MEPVHLEIGWTSDAVLHFRWNPFSGASGTPAVCSKDFSFTWTLLLLPHTQCPHWCCWSPSCLLLTLLQYSQSLRNWHLSQLSYTAYSRTAILCFGSCFLCCCCSWTSRRSVRLSSKSIEACWRTLCTTLDEDSDVHSCLTDLLSVERLCLEK